MPPYTTDTSTAAEEVQLELLRAMSPAERSALAFRLSAEAVSASKRAIARVYPHFTPQQMGEMFVELHYGKDLADGLREHNQKNNHE